MISRSSSIQINTDKIASVPRGGVGEKQAYSGGVSEQRSQRPRAAQTAGLPLISSSFIPSPHIITPQRSGVSSSPLKYISASVSGSAPDRLADFHKTDEGTSPLPRWSRIKCSAGLQIQLLPVAVDLWAWHMTSLSSCISMHAAWWSCHWWFHLPNTTHSGRFSTANLLLLTANSTAKAQETWTGIKTNL